jgi:hypothetical protein
VSATTREYTRKQVQDKYENFKRFQLPKIWKEIANPDVFAPSGALVEPLHKLVDWNKLDGEHNRLNRIAYNIEGFIELCTLCTDLILSLDVRE